MIDDFDRGQIDDCGDGYFNERLALAEELHDAAIEHTGPRTPLRANKSKLSAEDYMDLFLENFN